MYIEVKDLDVELNIHVDDSDLRQTIYSMVARLRGETAHIEHQQKLQRIRAGVRAAQSARKWTERPPAGFVVEDTLDCRREYSASARCGADSGEFSVG